jgi:hypothetical protein
MRIVPCLMMLTMAAMVATAPVCRARDASAEILPLEDKDIAKLDKEETKRKRLERQLGDPADQGGDSAECGAIDIGNTTSSNSNQSATNRIAPHDTTVIVTGSIYNTANCGQH